MTDPQATQTPRTRVLGIDPGTRVAGYGILDVEKGRRPRLVAHGAIRFPPSPLAARLEALFRELKALIEQYAPRVLAIECIFHGKNFQSILKVGEARGVAVLAAQLSGLEIREYAPAMIKKAATGNGNAAKEQVQRMMGRVLDMRELPEPVDASDALAAAFCHSQRVSQDLLGPAPPRRARPTAMPGASKRGAVSPCASKRGAVSPCASKRGAVYSGASKRGAPAARRIPASHVAAVKGLNLTELLRTGKARFVTRRSRTK